MVSHVEEKKSHECRAGGEDMRGDNGVCSITQKKNNIIKGKDSVRGTMVLIKLDQAFPFMSMHQDKPKLLYCLSNSNSS